MQEVPQLNLFAPNIRHLQGPVSNQRAQTAGNAGCASIEILGLLSEFCGKKKHSYAEQVNLDSISCNMFVLIRGFDPPHWPGF